MEIQRKYLITNLIIGTKTRLTYNIFNFRHTNEVYGKS